VEGDDTRASIIEACPSRVWRNTVSVLARCARRASAGDQGVSAGRGDACLWISEVLPASRTQNRGHSTERCPRLGRKRTVIVIVDGTSARVCATASMWKHFPPRPCCI